MSYQVEAIPYFKKRAKRLIKKIPSLKQELANLGLLLSNDPKQRSPIGKDGKQPGFEQAVKELEGEIYRTA